MQYTGSATLDIWLLHLKLWFAWDGIFRHGMDACLGGSIALNISIHLRGRHAVQGDLAYNKLQ